MTTSRQTKHPILDPRSLWAQIRARDLQALENGQPIIVLPPPAGDPVVFGDSGGFAWKKKGYFLAGKGHHNELIGRPFFEVRTTQKVIEVPAALIVDPSLPSDRVANLVHLAVLGAMDEAEVVERIKEVIE